MVCDMSRSLALFPLNSVVFPGMSVPLHVFENRYVELVETLLEERDPSRRTFGTVAIREGYEVGETGGQSLYRVGCLLQLSEADRNEDGTWDILAVGLGRFRLREMEVGALWPQASVDMLDDGARDVVAPELIERSRGLFDRYRDRLSALHGDHVFTGTLPRDPAYLSWTLAATVLLPLADRQSLLEADDTHLRLAMVNRFLRDEMRTMSVLPSLPAVDIARSGWSPN